MYLAAADNLRTLIASTATWQTMVGATGNAAQKLAAGEAAIFLFGAKEKPTRPFIVIDPVGFGADRVGEPGTFDIGGTLAWRMELDRPDEDTWEEEFRSVAGTLDDLTEDVLGLAGRGTYLCVRRFEVENHNRAHFVEQSGYWSIQGRVTWP